MAFTEDAQREYCDTLLRHFRNVLTEWEEDRVVEWQERLARGYMLSDRQGEVLDEIMERCAKRYGR